MMIWTKNLRVFMAAALIAIAALLVPGRPAQAHAILMESTPAILGTVVGPDVEFQLRYNSRIDAKRSRLILFYADKSQHVLPIGPASTSDVLMTSARLKPGKYTLRWQVLAIDGHITRGDVPFTVTGG